MSRALLACFLFAWLASIAPDAWAAEPDALAAKLREFDSRVIVLGTVRQSPLSGMLSRDVEARLRAANRADSEAWAQVKTREDWERFKGRRIEALRRSLGEFPPVPDDLRTRVTGKRAGDGYQVENMLYETRPGLIVTANLYRPAKPSAKMPAIVVSHSHLQPKHNGARQDMAMTWARAGCVVLVPDHLGHGERQQHPFGSEGGHDYHFRYDAGIQLHLAGESLMGWFVWDLMRGVDVLLARPDIDPERIVLVSEPAGGGDVAAVAAALDSRITGVMVQNFGGPEPETPYPLLADAEESFDYVTSGSWESTRNLRLSARDGFLPWTIVASIAPRKLIYYHEFYWDHDNDPVWQRLQRVYGFYGAQDSLAGLAGHGFVVGSAPENTHWLPESRELLYPVLERWFRIANPGQEYGQRRPEEELLCLTPQARPELSPLPLHQILHKQISRQMESARAEPHRQSPAENRELVRRNWSELLGNASPTGPSILKVAAQEEKLGAITVERLHLQTEPGILVPTLLLLPPRGTGQKLPVVVGVAQGGKESFLKHRSDAIAELLSSGIAVCLPDVRGTGETRPDDARDRRSAATTLSSSEWMLGRSLLGGRLADLRSLLGYLRTRPEIDSLRIGLWGDSFAAANPAGTEFAVPHSATNRPVQSEPLGGLLALLAALYEDEVRAVYVRGGLSDYQSALQAPFCYVPHDAVIPGILSARDVCDLAAALAPRPLLLEGLVDGLNREVSSEYLAKAFEPALATYAAARAEQHLHLQPPVSDKQSDAGWFVSPLLSEEGDKTSWSPTGTLDAPEAFQAAAADETSVFAISSTVVARYDRETGKRLVVSLGEAQHLNSGFLEGGKLFCAHSNYPKTPEQSEIKVLDLASMKLGTFHDFGNFGGSLTWAVRHEGHWWCNFARYGVDNGQTFLVRFDDRWRERGRWTYPPEVIRQIGKMSLSGGLWHEGELLVTDHDNPRLYRLRIPKIGTVLEFVGQESAPFTGQGIAHDPKTGGLVGINRAKRQVVFARRAGR